MRSESRNIISKPDCRRCHIRVVNWQRERPIFKEWEETRWQNDEEGYAGQKSDPNRCDQSELSRNISRIICDPVLLISFINSCELKDLVLSLKSTNSIRKTLLFCWSILQDLQRVYHWQAFPVMSMVWVASCPMSWLGKCSRNPLWSRRWTRKRTHGKMSTDKARNYLTLLLCSLLQVYHSNLISSGVLFLEFLCLFLSAHRRGILWRRN